ncbi:MAG: hypothetical protein R2809_09695 [Flavobacteriales bacterium]
MLLEFLRQQEYREKQHPWTLLEFLRQQEYREKRHSWTLLELSEAKVSEKPTPLHQLKTAFHKVTSLYVEVENEVFCFINN